MNRYLRLDRLWKNITPFGVGICLLFTAQASADPVLTFGVVPQQSAKKTATLWGPLLKRVGEEAGIALQFRTARSIPIFEQRLKAGEYDFAYMNPYHYTVFSQHAYRALAKRRAQKIRGVMVVRKGSDAAALEDLDGKRVAMPSPAAFGASVLPQAALSQRGISITPQFVLSHDSVYLSVAKGLFPAGGGVLRTLNNMPPNIKDQLRVLWTTQAYTPHAFAVHERVPPNIRRAVLKALSALETDEQGLALLHNLKIKYGIEAAEDSDWNDVRAIDIDALNPQR